MASVEPAMVEELRQMSVSGIDGMAAVVLRELSISQERLASMGRRSAIESLAHFFCETLLRCRGSGANAAPDRCGLAMTQDLLAETLGMTSVHINRTLQAIRATGFANLADFDLVVNDFDALAELGEFDEAYLAPV